MSSKKSAISWRGVLNPLFGRLHQAFDATLADLKSEGLFKG